MQELIKIREENGQRLVSARELHEFLGLSKRFSAWFERYSKNEDYGFIENEDYVGCTQKYTANQHGAESERQDYAITIDMAKELSMLSKTPKGKEARKYFIQCEKQLQTKQFNLPTTYKEALLQLVQAEEEKEQLLLEKQNLEYTNNILTHTNKTYTTTEIAKELNLNSARELNRRLCKDKIQFIQNGTYVLYSDYANKGYTSIKQTVLDDDRIVYNTRWTDLGREFILKKYSQVGFEV